MQNFKNGKPTINLNRMIGYDMGENGEWLINVEQAKIVREIYNMYICGVSAYRIAAILNNNGTYTVNHKKWTAQSVLDVLRNEKYVGDLTMQKTITVDMLAHKVVKNKGIAKQFHIRDHHAPIVDRDVWERVQALVERNTFEKTRTKTKDRYAVLSNLYCSVCGKPYLRQRYSSKVASLCTKEILCKFGYPIFKCAANSKTDKMVAKLRVGEKRCQSEYLHECGIFQSFMEMLYQIRENIIEKDDDAEIVKSYYALCMERAKNSKSILYREYTDISERINTVKASIDELTDNQKELVEAIGEVRMFSSIISDYESELKELEKRREDLFTNIILADPYEKQFEYFVDSVIALPEIPSDNKYLIPFTANKKITIPINDLGMEKGKKFEYPIYFDLEEQSQFAKGKNFCDSVIKSFCGELEKHGYLAGLYCSTYYLNNYVSNSVAGKYALWVAQYNYRCTYTANKYGIWQYSDEGRVNGINGNVDMNYCYTNYPIIVKAEGYNGYRKAVVKKASAYKTTATGTSNTSAKKSVDELAKEVIAGKWSVGDERKQKLTAAGYDYGKVQARVNELMKNQ